MRTLLRSSSQRIGAVTLRADREAERLVGRTRSAESVAVMRQVARAGDGGAIWLLVLLGMARKNPVASWRAAGVLAIGALIVNGPVKRVVRRERPEILEGVPSQPGGSSFPSGHAFTSWLTVGMLPAAGPVKAVIRIGAGIISGSRVYLRYHHLSDVLVGSLAGWAVGRLTRRFLRW